MERRVGECGVAGVEGAAEHQHAQLREEAHEHEQHRALPRHPSNNTMSDSECQAHEFRELTKTLLIQMVLD